MRAARTSKLVSALAILGLIVSSVLMVLVLNSSYLVNPTLPLQGTPDVNPGPTGTLLVQLQSNQDQSNRLSSPTGHRMFAVGDKAMNVSQATNSSSPFTQVLVTDPRGEVSQQLPPGRYVVSLRDETLDINIPVQISVGNETDLMVTTNEAAYPLVYSEESGALATAGSAQTNMFVELRSSTSVANLSEQVILKVYGAAPGAGYLVNATVVSSQPPAYGAQWLELGASGAVNPVNATSIVLTTWSYSDFVAVTQMGPYPQLDD